MSQKPNHRRVSQARIEVCLVAARKEEKFAQEVAEGMRNNGYTVPLICGQREKKLKEAS